VSVTSLERVILAGAKQVLQNQGLKQADILAWSTGPLDAEKGEVAVRVADPGVYIVVKKDKDNRARR